MSSKMQPEMRKIQEKYKDKKDNASMVAQQEELKKAIENGKKSIQGAMDKKDVESALASAKKNIDTIKTDAQLKEEEEEGLVTDTEYIAPQDDELAGSGYGIENEDGEPEESDGFEDEFSLDGDYVFEPDEEFDGEF